MSHHDFNRTNEAAQRFAPPGHFYSPHPKLEDLESNFPAIVQTARNGAGIDLNAEEQLRHLTAACQSRPLGPWQDSPGAHRFYYDNHFFRFGDSNAVWQIAKTFRPKRIIEVGSGFSTACWLDTFDHLGLPATLTSIEPYPDRVHQLCSPTDLADRVRLEQTPVQQIPLSRFRELEANDVLFIDSTHVMKSGSDVNYLFFHVLPLLAPSVLIHIHDIFWPFEYPLQWYQEGRAWNETFVLRAFLQYNAAFRIIRFNSYLAQNHAGILNTVNTRLTSDAGGSIWLMRNG